MDTCHTWVSGVDKHAKFCHQIKKPPKGTVFFVFVLLSYLAAKQDMLVNPICHGSSGHPF